MMLWPHIYDISCLKLTITQQGKANIKYNGRIIKDSSLLAIKKVRLPSFKQKEVDIILLLFCSIFPH